MLTSRALLLKAPKASAKVSRKVQNILCMQPYDKCQFNKYPCDRVFKMPHANYVALSGYPGHSPTREEKSPSPRIQHLGYRVMTQPERIRHA